MKETQMDKMVLKKFDHWFARDLYITTKDSITKQYYEVTTEQLMQNITSIRKSNYGGMISEVNISRFSV